MSVNGIAHGTDSPPQDDDSTQLARGRLSMTWYGVVSAMFFIYIGAAMAVAYGTADALIGIALTIVVYGIINRILSRYSTDNRASVALFSRTILGRKGAMIATIIFAATAIYYAVFEGSIVVFAFQTAFGGEFWIWSLVVVAYSTPLVIGRARRFLDRINGWLMPLYWGGLAAAVIWAGIVYGFSDRWLTQAPAVELPFASGGPGWLATFAAYMGIWIFMMYVMDFAALGRRKDASFHGHYTFGWLFYTLAFGVNALIGIFLTFTIPGLEASETGVAGGLVTLMGPLGLLIVFVSQTRINTANYYLGISNLQTFGERVLRLRLAGWAWGLIGAIIIFLLMLLPITQYILVALAWQGVLVTGWVGIALVHVLVTRSQEHGSLPDDRYKSFNRAGIIAWLVATASGIFFLESGLSWGSTWGPIITAVLAAALYLLLRSAFREGTALRPSGLDARSR